MNHKGSPISVVEVNIVYKIYSVTTLGEQGGGGASLAGSLDSSPGFATVCLRDLGKIISFFWTSHSSLVNKITGEDGLRFLGTLTFCDYRQH